MKADMVVEVRLSDEISKQLDALRLQIVELQRINGEPGPRGFISAPDSGVAAIAAASLVVAGTRRPLTRRSLLFGFLRKS